MTKRTNKDVLVHHREKGKKSILVAMRLKHQVGALAGLTSVFEREGYNILSGFVGSPDDEGYSRISFLFEATESRPAPGEVEQLFSSSRLVKDVVAKEGRNGLLVDSLNFPVSWNTGDRAVMLRTEFFGTMEDGLRRNFKSGADVLLHEMGFHHGMPTFENLLKRYPVRDKEDLKEVLCYYDASGWGKSDLQSFDLSKKKAVVRLMDNFECSAGGATAKTGSNFVRGHIEGLFSVIFGEGVKVAETKCITRGDQYCEFTASM